MAPDPDSDIDPAEISQRSKPLPDPRKSAMLSPVATGLAAPRVSLGKSEVVQSETPRLWLNAFWGFGPANEGYLGCKRPGDRDRFLAHAFFR
jgi:hypothetical protein